MRPDVEKGDVGAAARPVQQYGATELNADKVDSPQKLPLLFGLWDVSPSKIYSIGLAVYIAWFVVQRLADIGYILTVDARFPPGLGHLYPSEEERLASVSYTRQVLLCRMLWRTCIFGAVLSMILLGLFARFDTMLRVSIANIGLWWEESRLRAWCSSGYTCCCGPFTRCCGACWSPMSQWSICRWCSEFKHLATHGRLFSDLCNLSILSWRELLVGSVYLVLISACFYVISAPFILWSSTIDLKFGFSNPLVASTSATQMKLFFGLFGLIWQVPLKFVFLLVLQYRRGWLVMWAMLMAVLLWAQYNIQDIAPAVLDMKNAFPNSAFAVGRNFPWVRTDSKESPYISLNRIYFKDPSYGGAESFSTNDKSQGQLTLAQPSNGKWTISDASVLYDASAPKYSETSSAAASGSLDDLRSKTWTVGAAGGARMGVRSGSHLRDELYGFARERHIGISQIYMVDGSHKDIRANAFVAGAGNASVIGLFDTLFLGRRNVDTYDSAASSSLLQLIGGEAEMQHASEILQDVDTAEEKTISNSPPRSSAPTQAMGDAEIISILAHELGHSDLKHLEQGMVVQAITSFITFAALGWMAHSPLAAAALTLHAPLIHVGACAYDYVVGPPLEGIVKLFTDAHTRHNEYEADAYAALISEKYATGLQTALAKLSINSNHDPDVPFFYELLHDDHPAFSRRYAHIEATKQKAYPKAQPR